MLVALDYQDGLRDMKKLLLLSACLLIGGCATEPTQPSTDAQQAVSAKKAYLAHIDNVKIGMSRAEIVGILGEPTSVTDTASAVTAVWVFESGATEASPPAANNRGFWSAVGGIAATVAGAVIPYAGVATSVGTQVYNANNADSQNATPVADTDKRVVTIEFREDKAFSIQRAKPSAMPR